MSMQAARNEDCVFPVTFTLSLKDHERAKIAARQNRKSFAQYVRDLVVDSLVDVREHA